VQEAFLQAFTALGRLRDPDRFGAWLAGIVRNVHRAATRRAPPLLPADWPEDLHPGTSPIAFDIEGVRSGCALGMESAYPELILDCEQAGVHGVLLPAQGPGASFAVQALGHASSSSNWTGYAT
jgi:predicted amidohydrolase